MKVDIGFWDINGNYIPDIQEVSEVEMDKEIIIDGVNVAGCGYFCEADNECSICGMGTDGEDTFCKYCKDNLNCYYKQLKRLEQENTELKAENERLKEEFRIESLTDKTTGETNYRSNLVNKYRTILQEIMVIAEAPKPFIDFSETKTATEVRYDYAAICNELELRLHKVLELITKAGSEG